MGTRTTGTSGSPSNKTTDGHLVEYFNSKFQENTGTSGEKGATTPGGIEASGGVNTGGGGGGGKGTYPNAGFPSGAGGSGVVYIRYQYQ